MPFARLHSQMVCTQSEPAEIPQHMFVQILVQVGGDRKRRTSTPTPLLKQLSLGGNKEKNYAGSGNHSPHWFRRRKPQREEAEVQGSNEQEERQTQKLS